MYFIRLYVRVLGQLRPVWRSSLALVIANLGLAFAQFAEPWLFGRVVDRLAGTQGMGGPPRWEDVGPWLAAWAGFGVFSIVAGIGVSLFSDRLAHRRRFAVMADFFEHLMRLPASYHASTHTGRLLKSMMDGANGMFGLWLAFFREHCAGFVALFVLLPMTLFVNWRLGAILVALLAVFAIAMNYVIRKTQDNQGVSNEIYGNVTSLVSDVLGNLPAIQSFTRIEREARDMRAMAEAFLTAQFPVLTWWALANVATRVSSTVTLTAIFVTGVWLDIRGLTTLGEIVAFMSLATSLIGRLEQINSFVYYMFGMGPAIAGFFDVMRVKSNVAERANAIAVGRLNGDVRFEHVGFSYGPERKALNDIVIEALRGRVIALVGGTGSGKSTALALLHRAFDPTEGRITIDGIDIRDMTLNSLRANIGVVFQEPYLFARSIEDNLRIGKPDATPAEMARALALAQADFVDSQPQGLATMVGERGRSLSGGERQRLAIAHRLATIRKADLILVLDHGRVIESGAFDELVEKGGAFAALASAQFMAKAN